MPGYRLIELANLQPHKARGIAPAENVIGVLDFLRELDEEPFPLPRMSKWRVVGLEEVLFAARPREEEVAAEIHARLNNAAASLEQRMLAIQVVLSGEIVRGAYMTVKYRGASLPLYMIFNSPHRHEDANGNAFYPIEFHLSSP
ncbi:MAG TPA: hypothetical protein PKK06_05360 [Phycisphaerae bacterium]|nr:hypothetical protein [Phycisphaerae bacterium]HNU44815.1 hypothetical protein [Phycisphaerae bacterium]